MDRLEAFIVAGPSKAYTEFLKEGSEKLKSGKDEDGRTIFHRLAQCPTAELMKDAIEVLESGWDEEDDDGWTPLLISIAWGHISVVVELIKRGARTAAKPKSTGNTGLHISASKGHLQLLEFLWNTTMAALKEERNRLGFTPLMLAVSSGKSQSVAFLLQKGADAAVREPRTQDTILHIAAENQDPELVRVILEHASFLDGIPNKCKLPRDLVLTREVAQAFRESEV